MALVKEVSAQAKGGYQNWLRSLTPSWPDRSELGGVSRSQEERDAYSDWADVHDPGREPGGST